MKKSIVLILAVITLVFACENPVDPAPPTPTAPPITGTWSHSTWNETFSANNGTYEKVDAGLFGVSYAEMGTIVVNSDNVVVTKTHEKPDGTGDWVATDFATNFEARRAGYSEYLEGLGMTAVTTDEYWNIQYTWSQDGTNSPYPGYTAGMTLEQYKVAAESIYTAALTRTMTYTIDPVSNSDNHLLTLKDGSDTHIYDTYTK